jgi:two-component sensor histidine kinase
MPGGEPKRDVVRAYAIGAGCFLAALVLRSVAGPWIQGHFPYLTFFVAVIVAAYLAGFAPAVLVALAGALTTAFGHASPTFGGGDLSPLQLGAPGFVFVALLCAAAIANLKSARDRLEVERRRYADLAENRDLLYRELQHRVSNNIQVVAALLRLQASGAPPAVRVALTEASARIHLIGRIQRELHGQSGGPSPFCDFARDLLTDALAAAGARDVDVVIEGGAEPLHPDQATPVALVLLECVNNALEHAYANGRGGVIQVGLARTAEDWRLTVRDDGPGPPPEFDIDRSHSFGLRIAKGMASQLNGRFTLVNGRHGALCTLNYPVIEEA